MSLQQHKSGGRPEGLVLPPGIRQDYLRSMRQTGKRIVLKTIGASMAPLIRPGACVEVEFVSISDVQPGDMILFEKNQGLVLHRVIRRRRDASGIVFTEKGDSQVFGTKVREEFVLGRVTHVQNGERIFDPTSCQGRMLGRLISIVSLMELGLFRIKRNTIGKGTSLLGHIWVVTGLQFRRFLMCFVCKR